MNAKAKSDCTPRVYVGTYGKYNNGSIAGKWLNLEDYSDKDEFLEACAELHKDEEDPEFMFQDRENIPERLISESHIDEEFWELMNMDDDDRQILEAYRENCRSEADLDEAKDHYMGTFKSLEDYVIDYWEQCGDFKASGNWWHPTNYIDWEGMALDLQRSGDIVSVEHDGKCFVFSNS